jgi:hypothetical protein
MRRTPIAPSSQASALPEVYLETECYRPQASARRSGCFPWPRRERVRARGATRTTASTPGARPRLSTPAVGGLTRVIETTTAPWRADNHDLRCLRSFLGLTGSPREHLSLVAPVAQSRRVVRVAVTRCRNTFHESKLRQSPVV